MRLPVAALIVGLLAVSPCLAQQQGGSAFSPSAESLYEQARNALIGSATSRNDIAGVDLMRRSAEAGYIPALVALGSFYDTGQFLPQEPPQAVPFYKNAAEKGDRLAQWSLGRLYLNNTGVQRDLDEAARWLQRAADQGDPFGEYLLGRIKEERNDYAGAVEWYRKAAQQGLPQAQRHLGDLLRQGQAGVHQDKFEAYVWLLVSFNNGVTSAGTDLSLLEGDLNSKQLQEAKSRARALGESTARSVTASGCTGWDGEFLDMPDPPPLRLQVHCH